MCNPLSNFNEVIHFLTIHISFVPQWEIPFPAKAVEEEADMWPYQYYYYHHGLFDINGFAMCTFSFKLKYQAACSEWCFSCTNHRLLGIFVVRVPANAHHHFVDIPIIDAGPAIVDPSADICWKIVHHWVRKVGWRWEREREEESQEGKKQVKKISM